MESHAIDLGQGPGDHGQTFDVLGLYALFVMTNQDSMQDFLLLGNFGLKLISVYYP